MSELTVILEAIDRGNPHAAEKLLPLVYDELRKLAAQKMAQEAPGHTLQPTALVHEAWLRLVAADGRKFDNRGHFFGAAAQAMRRILIDHARRKSACKHGGVLTRVDLDQIDIPDKADGETLLCIDECIESLAREDPKSAELVKLRFFGGLSEEEAAQALGVSDRTVRRYWRFARAWLRDALSRPGG